MSKELEYKILRVFGPSIYHSTMNEEMMDTLRDIARTSRDDGKDMRSNLAGNIDRERSWATSQEIKDTFYYQLRPHVRAFTKSENARFQHNLLRKPKQVQDYDKLNFSFATDTWINYQKANEINPIHAHNGNYSSVLYIDVPEVIAKENDEALTNITCRGQIEFIFGTDQLGVNGTHKIVPKTGDILLFDAKLKHCVYPFRSNTERISMSFNVGNINFDE